MRGHSLVELMEHDDSTADVILQSICGAIHMCTAAFIVHTGAADIILHSICGAIHMCTAAFIEHTGNVHR